MSYQARSKLEQDY
uniref:Uncharacterized protein n=1 Tax=Arundo donax TaxID=35708 RepID=A0A0A9H2T4_ARUDO